MAWHARGQGFKSPQLHPRSEAQIGPSRLQIPRLGQQIGSNPCCLGGSGRPARRQRRPASPPGNGHIRPPAATLTLQRSTGSVGARQIDSSRGNDLILIRVLHPGLFPQERDLLPGRPTHRLRPLGTTGNRSAPMACGPNVDQPRDTERFGRTRPSTPAALAMRLGPCPPAGDGAGSPGAPRNSTPAWGRSMSPRAAGQGPAAPCARHSGSGRARRGTPCVSARRSALASRPSRSPCAASP